jgi:DNA-binding transcriptional LysR family regulator
MISEKAMVAVVPTEHRLASRNVIRVGDLSGEPLVMLPENSPTAQLVDATFHQEGAVLSAAVVAGNSIAVCCLVRRGLGVGLVNPLTFAGGMFSDLVIKPFRPRVSLHTCLYLPRHYSPAPPVARLVDHLRALALEC